MEIIQAKTAGYCFGVSRAVQMVEQAAAEGKREENVSCSCDFTRGDMRVFAETKAVFLLGDLVAMAVRYGLRALRLYLRMKKQRKISQEKAVQ